MAQELRDQQGKTSSECPGDVMSFGVAMVFWPTFKVSGMTWNDPLGNVGTRLSTLQLQLQEREAGDWDGAIVLPGPDGVG